MALIGILNPFTATLVTVPSTFGEIFGLCLKNLGHHGKEEKFKEKASGKSGYSYTN